MRSFVFFLVLVVTPLQASTPTPVDVLIVVGAPGEPVYREIFDQAKEDWINGCRTAKKTFRVIEADSGETNQIERVKEALLAQGAGNKNEQDLWIIMIGHGTFDGKEAKFNLQGPDVSAKEISEFLATVQRPTILINTASASAPFINALSNPHRIIVTATKSGHEENFARFGIYIAKAITDLSADLDKDGQVSVLEAFLMATRRVEEFYESEKRLATEHALIDDNGDGKGTPATFYSGVRPAKKPDEAVNLDGFRAHQIHFQPNEEEANLSPAVRKRRNDLELQLERARLRKQQTKEDEYLKEIEPIILELSRLYRDARAGVEKRIEDGTSEKQIQNRSPE